MTTTPDTHRSIPVKQTMPLSRVRKMMVQSMQDSVQRAALSQVTREMDLSAVQATRAAAGEQRHSFNTYIMAAVARTLPNHPLLNAELVDNKVVVFAAVNLGMAIAVPDGLVVTVIRDADKRSLDELAHAAEDLAGRARSGKLKLADIEGGIVHREQPGHVRRGWRLPAAAPAGRGDPAGGARAFATGAGRRRTRRTTDGLVQPDLRPSVYRWGRGCSVSTGTAGKAHPTDRLPRKTELNA